MSQIPRTLHFVWVGDESLRPDACIETWRRLHPNFEIKVWGNEDWHSGNWRTGHHMAAIASKGGQFASIADLIRWEVLLAEGGVAIDADSICLQTLPDWLLDCDFFAAWENEQIRPGLVANGYVGARPGHDLLEDIVSRIEQQKNIVERFVWRKMRWKRQPAWKTTGPLPLTNAIKRAPTNTATILPSHFFIPVHYSGRAYSGHGPIYACEMFASTPQSLNDYSAKGDPDKLIEWAHDRIRAAN